ncbi:hypothetical protein C8F01DRAFT_1231037 [Mycena amicta]|nr:hypothetical protein C8F01DRAFT_1231037 [Mycena amicta]
MPSSSSSSPRLPISVPLGAGLSVERLAFNPLGDCSCADHTLTHDDLTLFPIRLPDLNADPLSTNLYAPSSRDTPRDQRRMLLAAESSNSFQDCCKIKRSYFPFRPSFSRPTSESKKRKTNDIDVASSVLLLLSESLRCVPGPWAGTSLPSQWPLARVARPWGLRAVALPWYGPSLLTAIAWQRPIPGRLRRALFCPELFVAFISGTWSYLCVAFLTPFFRLSDALISKSGSSSFPTKVSIEIQLSPAVALGTWHRVVDGMPTGCVASWCYYCAACWEPFALYSRAGLLSRRRGVINAAVQAGRTQIHRQVQRNTVLRIATEETSFHLDAIVFGRSALNAGKLPRAKRQARRAERPQQTTRVPASRYYSVIDIPRGDNLTGSSTLSEWSRVESSGAVCRLLRSDGSGSRWTGLSSPTPDNVG